MLFKITQEHINEASDSCDNCPLQLAMTDAGFHVCVYNDEIVFGELRHWEPNAVKVKTTPAVETFTVEFDEAYRDGDVTQIEPIELEVEIPEGVIPNVK